MSYKKPGSTTLLDTLVLNSSSSTLNIEVMNNESIKFDLSSFKDEYTKIIINFGDNTDEARILKPLYASSGAISVETINWAFTEHYFAFKSEDDFSSDKKMEVMIYSIDENKFKKIIINYKVLKNNISGISRALTLLNANIRNDGKMAYTIQNDSDRQIIFFTSSDNVLKYIHEES